MRSLAIDGKKKFCPEEYLTLEQVMTYFRRMKEKVLNIDEIKYDENLKSIIVKNEMLYS